MRQAGIIADQTMAAGVEAAAVGVRECDVAAALNGAQTRGTEDFGGDPQAEVIVISTGAEVDCPHLAWTDRPLEANSQLNIELSGVRKRYNAALSRSLYLGSPPDTLRRLADATLEGLENTLERLGPGMPAHKAWSTYNDVLKRYGQHKPSRLGYSIGIGYTPSWIERTISLRQGDETLLEPNMTFHIMCGMWQDDCSFVASETVVITDAGCERLTQYPQGLVVL